MTSKRLDPKERSIQLLDIAVDLAAKHGINSVTRKQIAEAAEVVEGTVSARLGTMADMRRSVMRQAIAKEVLPIVAHGVIAKDKHALKAPEALRNRALEAVFGMKPA